MEAPGNGLLLQDKRSKVLPHERVVRYRINHYLVYSLVCFLKTSPFNGVLSGGQHYPTSEQLTARAFPLEARWNGEVPHPLCLRSRSFEFQSKFFLWICTSAMYCRLSRPPVNFNYLFSFVFPTRAVQMYDIRRSNSVVKNGSNPSSFHVSLC